MRALECFLNHATAVALGLAAFAVLAYGLGVL